MESMHLQEKYEREIKCLAAGIGKTVCAIGKYFNMYNNFHC